MLRKEFQVIQPFAAKPWQKLTFREIKKFSKKKSESYIFNTLKKLTGQGILKKEKVGSVVLYSLTPALKTQAYLGFVAEFIAWNKKHIPLVDLEKIALRIPTPFFTLAVSGSYAKGRQKKTSDLDLIIIVGSSLPPKKVYAEIRHACEINIPPIHPYVFKKSEFLAMLLDEKPNYGKEVVKNNLILFGGGNYYKIIAEAMKHGFNG